ncbi:hypothetical protein ACFX13_032808 [Malus domestica]
MALPAAHTISHPNVTNFLTIKLDRTNYPLWRAQFIPLLRSRGLLSFVDGSTICPPAFLSDADGTLTDTVNPLSEAWIQQDQLVLSWLASSLTPNILSVIVNNAWRTLQDRYASSSHNRVV